MTQETSNKDFNFEVSSGWVAIPRKIQDEIFYTDSHFIHLYLHLVLNVNRKDGIYQGVTIKKYQILTGRKSLSEKTGINESKIERILAKLEELKYIEQQKTTKYRVITILDSSILEIFEQQKTTTQQQKNNKKHKQQEEHIEQEEQYNIEKIAEDIYSLYALKKGKKGGIEKLITYLQKSKDIETEIKKIKNHIENYNQFCSKDNYKFMKHFDTYVNQQVWNDEVVIETKPENKIDLDICIEDIKKGTARFEPQNLSIWYSRGFTKLTQEQVKIIQGGINEK